MHYKQNNKESRTYVQGLRSFGSTLPRGIKGILKRNGYNYSEIVSKWKVLVGKNISDFSYPKSIKIEKNSRSGTLIVGVKRGNEITVEYSKEQIINKINSYFGYKLISNVRLQAYNETKNIKIKKNALINDFSKNFKVKINEVKNDNIRNSLLKLLNSIKND
jgi:hypothetical protein